MTEQELRDNKFRADVENALHQNRSLTMIEHTIWEMTKAYADERESKSANKVAEIRRLCKAFLYDLPCSHNVAVIGDFLDAYADNKILDEFKKTVVAAKDAEIKRLRDALERVMRHHIDESISILDNYLEMKDIARVAWKASIYPAPVTEGKETANESSKLLQCPHCERMFDPSDENDFCLNGTCDAK